MLCGKDSNNETFGDGARRQQEEHMNTGGSGFLARAHRCHSVIHANGSLISRKI